LNLGGLYFILNKEYNIRGEINRSVLFENKNKIIDYPTNEIIFLIKIHMKNILPFQRESFEIIKDNFQLVEDLDSIDDYEIISIYGETCFNGVSDNADKIFPFLRNIFLEKYNFEMKKYKRIYITRKNSENYHNGTLKRYMMNEIDFIFLLDKYNIEYIQLKNYSILEKIKIFAESEVIISPNSSALTFALFSNKNSKVIEICNEGTNHYSNICNVLNLNYYKYNNIIEDNNGNFNLNTAGFENYLINIL